MYHVGVRVGESKVGCGGSSTMTANYLRRKAQPVWPYFRSFCIVDK
jgi:hypothetical protein